MLESNFNKQSVQVLKVLNVIVEDAMNLGERQVGKPEAKAWLKAIEPHRTAIKTDIYAICNVSSSELKLLNRIIVLCLKFCFAPSPFPSILCL